MADQVKPVKPPSRRALRRRQRVADREMKVAREVAADPNHHGCLGVYTTPEAAEVAAGGRSLLDRSFDREAG